MDRNRVKKRPVISIALACLLIGVAIWWIRRTSDSGSTHQAHHGGASTSVAAAHVDQGDIRVFMEGLGTVTPLANVTVRARIAGLLMKVAFKEGQLVKEGDFLFQIDPRPYQVALEQAEGTLKRDQALLKEALLDQARYQKLLKQSSIASQTVDVQNATVLQDQGTVITDQAAVDSAKLNLVYCHITSPTTGRIGLRQVDQGNYVQTSDTNGLVVVTQLQPISVIFTLPEDDLTGIQRQPGGKDGRPPALAVQAWDRADTMLISNGHLDTTDNEVDTTTGTVKLRAMFDNADNKLFPNQFVNAKLLVETHRNVLRAPATSVQNGEPGTFVYVVQPDHTVRVQAVKLGPQDADKIEVLSGLKLGDEIVTDGADHLKDGAKIRIPGDRSGRDAPAGNPSRDSKKPATQS